MTRSLSLLGCLADVLRTAHSLGVRVCHASLDVDPETARVDMQLFLRNAIGTRPLAGDAMLRPLLYQLRKAIAVPAAVLVTPSGEGHADSLAVHVLALPDTAGRGRPRVSLAIAEAVEKMGMCVDSSFVGMLNAQTALQQVTSPQRHTVAAALSLNVLQARLDRRGFCSSRARARQALIMRTRPQAQRNHPCLRVAASR